MPPVGPTCSLSAAGTGIRGATTVWFWAISAPRRCGPGASSSTRWSRRSRFLNVSAVEYAALRLPVRRRQPLSREPSVAGPLPSAGDRPLQAVALPRAAAQGDGLRWEQREDSASPLVDRQPALRGRALRASRPDERLLPHGVQLRRRRRRPPARVLPADGAPALGAVERTDRDFRRHGSRRRLRRHPALLDRRPAEPRRRPRRARPPLRPRCVRR